MCLYFLLSKKVYHKIVVVWIRKGDHYRSLQFFLFPKQVYCTMECFLGCRRGGTPAYLFNWTIIPTHYHHKKPENGPRGLWRALMKIYSLFYILFSRCAPKFDFYAYKEWNSIYETNTYYLSTGATLGISNYFSCLKKVYKRKIMKYYL